MGRPAGQPPGDERVHAYTLYERLRRSLANDAEMLLFRTYCGLYARPDGFELPALIPQVYLHYDPYTKRELPLDGGVLRRQRMDFLLLMPNRIRIVIELDGVLHYARPDTAAGPARHLADPARYAEMVAEDRALRLAGYEVYRFGGQEFSDRTRAATVMTGFFQDLHRRHSR